MDWTLLLLLLFCFSRAASLLLLHVALLLLLRGCAGRSGGRRVGNSTRPMNDVRRRRADEIDFFYPKNLAASSPPPETTWPAGKVAAGNTCRRRSLPSTCEVEQRVSSGMRQPEWLAGRIRPRQRRVWPSQAGRERVSSRWRWRYPSSWQSNLGGLAEACGDTNGCGRRRRRPMVLVATACNPGSSGARGDGGGSGWRRKAVASC
uniref:Secreted protein n=1 Tax=Oryza sativa subsp. japonica TaxID=39947 RepID=Q7EYD7_ORYSJ|nr:hypothetical protein [Oryza sativa Japonica Group]BAD33530.1 hypothetical protein [Oryza sativa Japonica Group]